MCRALFEKVVLLATFVALVVLSIIVASILAPGPFRMITNNLLTAIGQVAHALAIGAIILFGVGLALGIVWVLVELRHRTTYRVIGPNKYGPAQALTRPDGTVVPLQNGQMQMDPALMLEFVRKAMQISSQAATMARRDYYIGEEKPDMQQIEGPEEEEQIPDVVKYADIADEIPESMSLLGIHPANGDLELTDWEKLKMVWLVGSSSTGKSNTIFGKAYEAVNKMAKLAVVDQHATKKDSLAKKLAPLSHAFVRDIAVSDQQVLATLAWFKGEFERRVHCPVCAQGKQCAACSQKIVLICDEMNRMCRNEALIKPLKEIVSICGEESRGFGMYGWFLSQKCAHLKWLRDSAITVIVHRLTRFEEAKLACNDDTVAARRLLKFKIGRTYIYGVDFDEPVELQQPLYEVNTVESTITEIPESSSSKNTSVEQSGPESSKQAEIESVQEDGQPLDRTFPLDFSKLKQVRKMILEQRNQNDIICEVWGVTENSRAFRAAKEEFRQMLAYFASMAGEM